VTTRRALYEKIEIKTQKIQFTDFTTPAFTDTVKVSRVKVRNRTFKVKSEVKDLAQVLSANVSAELKKIRQCLSK